MTMSRRILWGFLILIFSLAVLVMQARLVREFIVLPILHFGWLAYLFLASIPQALIWAFLLFLVLRVAAHNLQGKQQKHRPEKKWPEQESGGRVRTLAKWVHSAREGEYYKIQLARHLAELVTEAITPQTMASSGSVSQRLRSGNLDVPPEVMAYLQAGMSAASGQATPFSAHVWRLWRRQKAASPLSLDPEVVVRYLEERLEIPHDG